MSDIYDLYGTKFGKELLRRYPSLPRGEEGRTLLMSVADALLELGGEKPGAYKNLSFLGSGAYAYVYWFKGNRSKVLKLTSDEDDAKACQILVKKPDKALLKVYAVRELVPHSLWAIITEKLTPLSSSEDRMWEEAHGAWETLGLSLRHIGLDKMFMGDLEEAMEDAERAGHGEWNRAIERVLPTLEVWMKKLTERGIIWRDLHRGNILMRGRVPIISDLGLSFVPRSGAIPILDV